MKKVAILGVGLMGGSLGMALRSVVKNKKRQYEILGIGRNAGLLKIALKKGAVDGYSVNVADISSSDIVVICYPVDMIVKTYAAISGLLSSETIVIDIGSVKEEIETSVKKIIKKSKSKPYFIGCHPMTGIEKNGIRNAKADLYKNSNVIVTDLSKNNNVAVISKMWKDIGCNIIKMSAKQHDRTVAFTSHMPHVIAFAFYKLFKEKNKQNKFIKDITAGSFDSITRVAKSSSDIWTPIFSHNRKNLVRLIGEFGSEIKKMTKRFGDKKALKKILDKSVNNENK